MPKTINYNGASIAKIETSVQCPACDGIGRQKLGQGELKCGCGGKIKYGEAISIFWFECKQCNFFWTLRKFNPPKIISLSEAIAAFRLATNQAKLDAQTAEIEELLEANRILILRDSSFTNQITDLKAENDRLKKGGINWISVKNRLPEAKAYCLVWFADTKCPFTGWYQGNGKWGTKRKGFSHTAKVTDWTEINLPEKGGE